MIKTFKFPVKIDITQHIESQQTIYDWVSDNDELLRDIILFAGESLAKSDETNIDMIHLILHGKPIEFITLPISAALNAIQINEQHWARIEDYEKAIRAREAGRYIKERMGHCKISDNC